MNKHKSLVALDNLAVPSACADMTRPFKPGDGFETIYNENPLIQQSNNLPTPAQTM